ncbi:MAG: right-handed parallel beta-helix repeat-containing protein [Verrucomicrobiaceae bacterium]
MSTEDPEERAGYEADLASLREIIQVLRDTPERSRTAYGMWIWAFVVAALLGLGFWGYQQWAGAGGGFGQSEVSYEAQKEEFERVLELRKWDEAAELVDFLEGNGIDGEWTGEARKRISAGQEEERGQQVGFLVGNAQAALEAGRLTDASKFCDEIEALQPDHEKLSELRELIKEGLMQVKSLMVIKATQKAVDEGDWTLAEKNLGELMKIHPRHAEIPGLKKRIAEVKERMEKDRAAANVLLLKARELDKGVYSTEALGLLKEAMRLDPNDEVRELYQKMSAYGRVLRVPGEFKTIKEALAAARANDRILLAKGTYQESLVVPAGIELVGESRKSTIIECDGADGSVITIGKPGPRVRIASLTLRHRGLVNDKERFPVVAVVGARLQLEDALISKASGHGLAIIEGGKAQLAQCEISECGWDGVAVRGEEASVTLDNVISRENLHHGVDFWDGGSGRISESQFSKNGRAGLVAMAPKMALEIRSSRSENNREVGILFSGMTVGLIDDCDIHENQLGGIVVQDESKETSITGNRVTKNGEAGIVIEAGVTLVAFEKNSVKDNTGKQVWENAVFPKRAEAEISSPPTPAPPLEE